MKKFIYVTIIVSALVILALALEGLIYWGIGAFVCWAFNISFQWKFVHGVALAFIVTILAGIFKSNKID